MLMVAVTVTMMMILMLVSEDEAARREKRRERNRVAAAKCRQNRQNQIENLNKKVNDLKAAREDLLRRLQATETEKIELEETIRQHGVSVFPSLRHHFVSYMYMKFLSAYICIVKDYIYIYIYCQLEQRCESPGIYVK
ncbi:unnamed protein product [Dibothriocephalus latus]|uniref:BZIP domain-containing protein n=1 Tax=Dibothriocephalus latus TaxID=60516 RepID=A0A3P7RBW7_DIBLA|nr:unnamed protein product [Dibothriocephalus latus]